MTTGPGAAGSNAMTPGIAGWVITLADCISSKKSVEARSERCTMPACTAQMLHCALTSSGSSARAE